MLTFIRERAWSDLVTTKHQTKMKTYELSSMMGKKIIKAENLEAAIKAAKEMDRNLRPAFGIDIFDESGSKLANVEDGKVELE